MKCLVTGAAGFIGSHLCDRLIKDGHHVIGFDNLSTGRISNLEAIRNHGSFHFFADHLLGSKLEEAVEGCGWVFHLAAKADIVPSIEKPTDYHETNVGGTLRLLELCRKAGTVRFVYAASSSCYGVPDRYPTLEGADMRPMYPYALTKYVAEQYVLHWSKVYKVPALSLRLFNVYGPRHRTSGAYGAVFGVFLSQLAHCQPLTVVGDGEQKRDFTYVIDVVDAFVRAAESGISGRAINIGTGHPRSVNELVNALGDPRTVRIPNRPGEPKVTSANATLAYKALGWTPSIKFEDGVRIMLNHLADYWDAPLWTPESIEKATRSWFTHLGG